MNAGGDDRLPDDTVHALLAEQRAGAERRLNVLRAVVLGVLAVGYEAGRAAALWVASGRFGTGTGGRVVAGMVTVVANASQYRLYIWDGRNDRALPFPRPRPHIRQVVHGALSRLP